MLADAFMLLHTDLPREAPGSDDTTREALRRLRPLLPAAPEVLDLGCGPGRQTLVLAEELATRVTAVDLHAPFLARLEAEAAARGLGHLVRTRCADFGALEEAPGSVDLLWSEGAIYLLGWAEGLRRWRPLLRPGGLMAVTEATWLTGSPPDKAAAFWREAYPTMGTIASNGAAARAAGFEVLDTFVLPESAWWDEYYAPLRARIESLRARAREDALLATAIAETEREISLYSRHGSSYGYVFYLLQSRGPGSSGALP
ncbi:class I SAM-dependent methyltransferase [Archangium violaceum]|uniref:SAM-dependent methyltransferase n=1 Tax=Archangium violaceum TaxID=83451 RepID=UPI001951B883|nr:class I SAM-dependent methyltransferase [Archangium violaceum]QRN96901.1 class I SAM-dependent methyltransferase [Archangium violaceum]